MCHKVGMRTLLIALALAVGCSSKSAAPSAPPVEPTQPAATDSGSETNAPAATAGVCGTRGGVQCRSDEFCDYGGDAQCGATDKGGSCKPITKMCTRIYLPVCGCDGNNYGNECEAHSHGVSVQHEGQCSAGT